MIDKNAWWIGKVKINGEVNKKCKTREDDKAI